MRKKQHSKTGYKGVYKNKKCKTYFYSTFVNPDPAAKGRIYKFGFKTAKAAYEDKIKYETETRQKLEYEIDKNRLGYLINLYLKDKHDKVKLSTFYSIKLLIDKYIELKYRPYTISQFAKNSNLDAFRDKISKLKVCVAQKNRILYLLKDLYQFGGLINLVNAVDVSRVIVKTSKFVQTKIEKPQHDSKNNFWTIEQWKQFLSVIDKKSKYYLLFVIFGQLGCRIGELRGLQMKHVNHDCTAITIEQQAQNKLGLHVTLITTPKTASSIRTVTISPYASKLLKDYFRLHVNRRPDNFLFFNTESPVGVQTIRRHFDYYTKLAKLPRITIHGIRHSNCTWFLSKKMTPREIGQVSKRLGHASVKLTLDIYMGLHEEESKNIKDTLNNMD